MYRCLKCKELMSIDVSLCPYCLVEEFEKMDHGDISGYLYATEEYLKRK